VSVNEIKEESNENIISPGNKYSQINNNEIEQVKEELIFINMGSDIKKKEYPQDNINGN